MAEQQTSSEITPDPACGSPHHPVGHVCDLGWRQRQQWDLVCRWGISGLRLCRCDEGLGPFLGPVLRLFKAWSAILATTPGVSTMTLARASFGERGSYLPSLVNITQFIGWTAVNTFIAAQSVSLLFHDLLGWPRLGPTGRPMGADRRDLGDEHFAHHQCRQWLPVNPIN